MPGTHKTHAQCCSCCPCSNTCRMITCLPSSCAGGQHAIEQPERAASGLHDTSHRLQGHSCVSVSKWPPAAVGGQFTCGECQPLSHSQQHLAKGGFIPCVDPSSPVVLAKSAPVGPPHPEVTRTSHCITASISCLLVGWIMPGLAQLVDERSTTVRGVVQWVCSQDGQRQQQVARAAAYCSCTASISYHAIVHNTCIVNSTYVDSAPVVLAKQQL